MGVTFSQFFPPKPTLTETNLPSQKGKVFIVTGGTSGVGLELCSILYHAGGKVYMAARSENNAESAISNIKSRPSTSPGELVFLKVVLDDLATMKPAVETFLASVSRLDVLFNNAGVSNPPAGSVSQQGHELTMATNCLGHYLFTQLLVPVLVSTAKTTSPGAVRVVWTSSIVVDFAAACKGTDAAQYSTRSKDPQVNYRNSKTGNWFLAGGLADQIGPEGVLSVTQNPGNLKTAILRHLPSVVGFVVAPLLYEAKMGAYTELWAGLSEDLSINDGGRYVIPWGRMHSNPRPDYISALRSRDEGGTGVAQLYVGYCEKLTAGFR